MIETARLILRVPTPADRAPLHAMWADPAVMADLGPIKDGAESDATLARHDSYRDEGLGFRNVLRKADGAVIGFCGLKRGNAGLPIAGEVEAGWLLASPYWGQGYAREAMVAALAWGWEHTDAPRIVAITAERNARSQALMVRLGMLRVAGGDFDHPRFEVGDPLRSTVTYAIGRPR